RLPGPASGPFRARGHGVVPRQGSNARRGGEAAGSAPSRTRAARPRHESRPGGPPHPPGRVRAAARRRGDDGGRSPRGSTPPPRGRLGYRGGGAADSKMIERRSRPRVASPSIGVAKASFAAFTSAAGRASKAALYLSRAARFGKVTHPTCVNASLRGDADAKP